MQALESTRGVRQEAVGQQILVYNCRFYDHTHDYSITRDYQSGYHITLVLDGTMWLKADGKAYQVQTNQIAWFDLKNPFAYGTRGERLRRCFVRVAGETVDRLFRHVGAAAEPCVSCQPEEARVVEAKFRQLCIVFSERSSTSETDATRLAEELLAGVAQLYHRQTTITPQQKDVVGLNVDPRVHTAKVFIEEHACRSLTVEQVATRVHLSKYHFIRLFKQTTGLTPKQYQLRCRLVQVRKLLLSTDLPIGEIAHRSGFGSDSHFINVFHKHQDETPLQFRIRNRRDR